MPPKQVELYDHAMGPEKGFVELVDKRDPEIIKIICTSERKKDVGVVFIIYIDYDEYNELCESVNLINLEDCSIESDSEKIRVREVPEEPPPPIPEAKQKNGNVHMLITAQLYKHPWGRCCCVSHGNKLEPITTDLITEEQVPWWTSPLTPFQLDLLRFADDPEENAMHVLTHQDHICETCGHYAWVVTEEDIPEELPPETEDIEIEEPLCPERNVLELITWESKAEAWEIFKDDPHNAAIIEKSGLPIGRANKKQKKQHARKFKKIKTHKPIHTIKQAFFFALGPEWSGTWANLDLNIIRKLPGLKKLEIPAEILALVELDDDDDDQKEIDEEVDEEVEEELDEEANHLKYILDEDESTKEDDDIPEVIEPKAQKPKAQKKKNAKKAIVEAAQALQDAITIFIEAINEED